MGEYLLSIGSTSPIEPPVPSTQEDETAAVNAQKALEEGGMEVVEKVKIETSKKLASSVEGVLAACVMYGLEDVARSVCLVSRKSIRDRNSQSDLPRLLILTCLCRTLFL